MKQKARSSSAIASRRPHAARSQRASPSPSNPTPRVKRRPPAASVERARSAFKKFSLSRYAARPQPEHHVSADETAAIVQRRIIKKNLKQLANSDSSARSMTLALPPATLSKLLPSYDPKTGALDLGEIVQLLVQNMRGTELFANGNPTLRRLSVQARAQQIFKDFAKEVKK